jgi:hypothetical protein
MTQVMKGEEPFLLIKEREKGRKYCQDKFKCERRKGIERKR